MKMMTRLTGLLIVVFAVSAWAAPKLEGTYSFVSRTKDGKAEMTGWNGTMEIKKGTMARNYAKGKDKKFYTGTMTKDGKVYVVKYTDAYKKDYIGDEHRNQFTWEKDTLTITSEDGKFKEVWKKN